MIVTEHVWGLVYASGSEQARRPAGVPRPQLEKTLDSLTQWMAPERVCALVCQRDRQWWSQILSSTPGENMIVEPRYRGSAIGILYSLLHIQARDPRAHAPR